MSLDSERRLECVLVVKNKPLFIYSRALIVLLISFCFQIFSHSQEGLPPNCSKLKNDVKIEIANEKIASKFSELFKNTISARLEEMGKSAKKIPGDSKELLQDLLLIYGNKNNQKFLLKNLGYGLGFQLLSHVITSFGVLPISTLSLDYLHNIIMTSLSTTLFLRSQFKPIISDLQKISKSKTNSTKLEEHLMDASNIDLIYDDYSALYSKIKGEIVTDEVLAKRTFREKLNSLKDRYKKDFFYSLIILSVINVSLDTLSSWKQMQNNPDLKLHPEFMEDKLKFQVSFVAINTIKSFLITTPLYLLGNHQVVDSIVRIINNVGTALFYQCARLRFMWAPPKPNTSPEPVDNELQRLLANIIEKRDQGIKYCLGESTGAAFENSRNGPKFLSGIAIGSPIQVEAISEIDQVISSLNDLKKIVASEMFQAINEQW